MRRIIYISIGLLFFSTTIFSQDKNFHIYLCFGQSNMEGAAAFEAQDTIVNSRFKTFQAVNCPQLNRTIGSWYTAVPPICLCNENVSVADFFGRTMVENLPDSITVGVINVAIGGCDIRIFDKDLYQEHDSTYPEPWFLERVKRYGGNPYIHLINLAKLAKQDGVIKGILLHQGETNAGDTLWTSYVKTIYDNIMKDLSLYPSSTPLLAGELVGADQENCCSAMNPIINTLPKVIPNAHVISSKGCKAQTDKTHFTAAGYRELGKRYSLKMLSLMGCTVN